MIMLKNILFVTIILLFAQFYKAKSLKRNLGEISKRNDMAKDWRLDFHCPPYPLPCKAPPAPRRIWDTTDSHKDPQGWKGTQVGQGWKGTQGGWKGTQSSNSTQGWKGHQGGWKGTRRDRRLDFHCPPYPLPCKALSAPRRLRWHAGKRIQHKLPKIMQDNLDKFKETWKTNRDQWKPSRRLNKHGKHQTHHKNKLPKIMQDNLDKFKETWKTNRDQWKPSRRLNKHGKHQTHHKPAHLPKFIKDLLDKS